jgi:uncharacterized protein YbcI
MEASADVRREISRGVVAIYKNHLGRGPTSARTYVAGDVVTTVCEDSLTRAETQLVETEGAATVRQMRRHFQSVMAPEIKGLVEATLARESRALLSDHDVERDIAVEVVLLEPEAGERQE